MNGATCRRTMWSLPAILVLSLILQPADAQIRFDLPAQPLGQALLSVGSLASANVFFDPAIVKGLRAPALAAVLTADEALARLLEGTHLHAIRVDEHTIRVVAEPAETTVRPSRAGRGLAHPASLRRRPTPAMAATKKASMKSW